MSKSFAAVREIDPTSEQIAVLQRNVGAVRFAQNWCLNFVKDQLSSKTKQSWSSISLHTAWREHREEVAHSNRASEQPAKSPTGNLRVWYDHNSRFNEEPHQCNRPSIAGGKLTSSMEKIYLAGRYSRRLELCKYRHDLRSWGFEVTSRWLDGAHQLADDGTPIGDDGERLVEAGGGTEWPDDLRRKFAQDDRDDVFSAGRLIAFTEVPRTGGTRGGRHVELGMALAKGMDVHVVGYRENVFCWLPEVTFHYTWDDFISLVYDWHSA